MSTFCEYFNQSDVDRLYTHREKKDYVAINIFHSNDWPSDVTIGTSLLVMLLMYMKCNNYRIVNIWMVLILAG